MFSWGGIMGLTDIFRVASIKAENERLRQELQETKDGFATLEQSHSRLRGTFDEIGAGDALKLKQAIESLEQQTQILGARFAEAKRQCEETDRMLRDRRSALVVLDDELLLESFALYKPKFAFTNSAQYKDQLDRVREGQKQLIREGLAVTANEQWTVNGSAAEGRKMVSDMKKLLLRSFNNECDYCVDNVKFNNIENHRTRIEKSFEAVKKLGRILNAQITDAYKPTKFYELDLAFVYQMKKQEEKEELLRLREEQREQQKLEQEIKAARDKIAKERKHFSAALADLEVKLAAAIESTDRQNIEERIAEVQWKFHALDDEEKVVDYREKNAKAGYVYIISNIGAFGENVFKIGMTRRLDPYERVYELGDASVPFVFDVHAMIFSDDAPALEAKLHGHFDANRLNKVNSRKEFFKAELREIEAVLRTNYDRVFDMVQHAPAEQFRESLKLGETIPA
jgi:hypothetical protein